MVNGPMTGYYVQTESRLGDMLVTGAGLDRTNRVYYTSLVIVEPNGRVYVHERGQKRVLFQVTATKVVYRFPNPDKFDTVIGKAEIADGVMTLRIPIGQTGFVMW